MNRPTQASRRQFLRTTLAGSVALPLADALDMVGAAAAEPTAKSKVFRIDGCPIHDGQRRHIGVDALLHLLSIHGTKFYKSSRHGALSGPAGLIAADDVVILKVNAQWKCRGGTNTDMLRGLIHRILRHPDGFTGEVVIYENGQGRPASFDGIHNDSAKTEYRHFPELDGKAIVNAEDQQTTTIDYLVQKEFSGKRVSSFLMDPFSNVWILENDHTANGYRRIGRSGTPCISYPCFTTTHGNRVELREGLWTGSGYAQNIKLIHCAVLKDHSGDIGMTGALKIVYGTLSMFDGTSARRHYEDLGSQCARMWTEVRPADLNILDCIWVSHGATEINGKHVSGCIGYPPYLTSRQNVLLAGVDPLAIDSHASKRILVPLGGKNAAAHDLGNNPRLGSVYRQAQDVINRAGGIRGSAVHLGEEGVAVIAAQALNDAAAKAWRNRI